MLINNIDQVNNKFDFTIIGSGPASITLALELEKKGFSSILFEAGDIEYTSESQKYYSGTVIGDKYFPLDITRLRYFGGTSNHWAGWCRPLDKHDLIDWPIDYNDLKKYLNKAGEILEIDPSFKDKRINEDFNQINFQFSPPVNFKEKYYEKIANSKKIGLCLKSPLLKIIGDNNGNVDKIEIFNNKKKKLFKINKLILGCGGLENSRILLWSQLTSNTQFLKNIKIGNFWMEHPNYEVGYYVGNLNKVFSFYEVLSTLKKYISPSYDFIKKHQIGNAGLKFLHLQDSPRNDRIISDLYCIAPNFVKQLFNKETKERNTCTYRLRMLWEQKPSFNNRIELSKNEHDDFGIPKISLYWTKNVETLKTARVMLTELGKLFAKRNFGRIGMLPYLNDDKVNFPENDKIAGHHHMGGTRVGHDPNNYDVVDKNLKLFGTNNLYLVGSSIFRTGGHANPTLTIVQLSLRLAEHLSSSKLKII